MIAPTFPERHFRFRFPEERGYTGSASPWRFWLVKAVRGAELEPPIGEREGRVPAIFARP